MYLLFLCFFLTSTIFTSQKQIPASSLSPSNALFDRVVYEKIDGSEKQVKTVNRTLLIFLDDSEYAAKKLGSLSIQSLIAISDQACPILISVSLLMNIFRVASTQGLPYQKICKSIVDALEAGSWICREVIQTSGLILMIPKNYLKGQTISQSTNNFAFYLGLLAPTPFPHEEKSFNTALVKRHKNFKRSKKSISEDFIETIENVFLSNKDYAHKKDYSLPQWSIYISGHGRSGVTVAGIRMSYFKELLDFLNSKITTKFLVYYTCFSTGKTEHNLFDASGKISKKSYNFPIMSMGIAEATTIASLSEREIKGLPGALAYKTNFEFEEFVEKTASSVPTSYLKLATSLIPTLHNLITGNLESFYALGVGLSNIPLIRPPHFDYFFPLIEILDINDELAAKKIPGTHISLSKLLAKKSALTPNLGLMAVLISTKYIPYGLTFGSAMPLIVSAQDGEALHIFDSIDVNYDLSILLALFAGISYATKKTFIIREVSCINKNTQAKEEHTNIMIKFIPGSEPSPWSFFETTDLLGENKPYKIVIGDKNTYTVVPTDNYMDEYKNSVDQILKEYDARKKSRTQIEHVYKKKHEEFEKKRKTNPKTIKEKS